MERQIEFEEMKAQLALLNKKLEKEVIVNERLIRRAMSEKVSGLNRQMMIITVVGILSIPYCTYVFRHLINASWTFTIVTIFFLMVCIFANLYQRYKGLRSIDVLTGNLTDVGKQVIRMKQVYQKWLWHVSIPFLCIWIPWVFYEVSQISTNQEFVTGMLTGCATGVVIGGLLGYRFYRRNMRTYNELLQQIEELSKD